MSITEDILLGVDYGTSKIGIALGRNGLVMPLNEVMGKHDMTAVHEITRIILENRVNKLIIGIPLSIDGKEGYQARKVRRFAKLLKVVSKKPVEFTNEFRTTQESIEEAHEKNINTSDDALAAALILKRYYNQHNV